MAWLLANPSSRRSFLKLNWTEFKFPSSIPGQDRRRLKKALFLKSKKALPGLMVLNRSRLSPRREAAVLLPKFTPERMLTRFYRISKVRWTVLPSSRRMRKRRLFPKCSTDEKLFLWLYTVIFRNEVYVNLRNKSATNFLNLIRSPRSISAEYAPMRYQ